MKISKLEKIKTQAKNKLDNYAKRYESKVSLLKSSWMFMAPGIMISLIGLSLFSWASIAAYLTGSLVFIFGAVCTVLAYKFIVFKAKVERFVKDFEGRVIVGNLAMHDKQNDPLADIEQLLSKKVVYH